MGKRMKKVLASAMSLSMVASMAMSGVGATTSRVDSLLSNMSLRQKITQMMMVDFRKWKTEDESEATDFTKMNSEVQKIVEDYDFGSVIFFANNIKETEQSYNLFPPRLLIPQVLPDFRHYLNIPEYQSYFLISRQLPDDASPLLNSEV